MKYTTLGRTGITVSRICLGCMSYGDKSWREWILEEDESMPFFRRAVEAGINFFDTADIYSFGRSEEVTGKALREYAKLDEVVIATKVFSAMGDGKNMGGLSRKHIQQGCEASLRRLGVEAIDLYQIHRFDPNVPIDETLAALDLLVQQGKVRHIGASSGMAWEMAKALSTSERHGWARFATMQNHYNLLYREEEREMNPLCRHEGVSLIPWSPLARGLLAGARAGIGDKSTTLRASTDEFALRIYQDKGDEAVIAAVRQVAEAKGVKMAQVALAWLLSKPEVAAPIVGATRMHHLEDAIGAVEVELTPDEIQALEGPYYAHPVGPEL